MISKPVEMLSADKEQDVGGGTGGERSKNVGIYFLESILIEKSEAGSIGVLQDREVMGEGFVELSRSGVKREPLGDAMFRLKVVLKRCDFIGFEVAGRKGDLQSFAADVTGAVFDFLEDQRGAAWSALAIASLTCEEIKDVKALPVWIRSGGEDG